MHAFLFCNEKLKRNLELCVPDRIHLSENKGKLWFLSLTKVGNAIFLFLINQHDYMHENKVHTEIIHVQKGNILGTTCVRASFNHP